MIKILVAEDEPKSRNAQVSRLRGVLGDTALIEAASDGNEAVDKAVRVQPELVFMDIEMPFKSGLEAAAGAAEGERKAAMVMCASVLLSCLLSLIMVFSAGLAKLALPYIVLYQVAWAVLSLLFPLLQRY